MPIRTTLEKIERLLGAKEDRLTVIQVVYDLSSEGLDYPKNSASECEKLRKTKQTDGILVLNCTDEDHCSFNGCKYWKRARAKEKKEKEQVLPPKEEVAFIPGPPLIVAELPKTINVTVTIYPDRD